MARGRWICQGLFAVSLLFMPVMAEASTAHMVAKRAAEPPVGASRLCRKYSWACATGSGALQNEARLLATVKRVNSQVNRRVREISDRSQYRREEYWALPTRAGGDCEDLALLKKQLLIQAGVDPSRLLLATALDRKRNGHAVLVLRTASGDFVLDNLTDRILHWSDTGYFFLRMQNPNAPHRWDAILARADRRLVTR